MDWGPPAGYGPPERAGRQARGAVPPRRRSCELSETGARLTAALGSAMLNLEGQYAGTDQVSEPFPLFRAEHGMDRRQGAREGVTQLGGALHAALAGSTGLAGVKGRAQDRVGELRPRAAVVHLGLRPLDLEFIEDAGQFGDLLLVQIELVRQEPQRAAHAPAAEARLPFERVAPLVAVARHRRSSPITAVARAVVFRLAVVEKVVM